MTRIALAAGILITAAIGGFFVGALGALLEDTAIDIDDDDVD
jgi:hypothetical protein